MDIDDLIAEGEELKKFLRKKNYKADTICGAEKLEFI